MKITTYIQDGIVEIINRYKGIGRRELSRLANIPEQEARYYLKLLANNDNNLEVNADGKNSYSWGGKVPELSLPIPDTYAHQINHTDVKGSSLADDKVINTDTEFVRPADDIKTSYSEKKATIEINSMTISTLEEALKAAKVDLDIWKVDKFTLRQVPAKIYKGKIVVKTNYQISVWLKPVVIKPVELAIKELIKELPSHVPQYAKYIGDPNPDGDIMLEISLYDLHMGMLAHFSETMNDYDLKIAADLFQRAVVKIIERASNYKIAKILFPVGNDFLHVNNNEGITPGGKNKLDMDSRFSKIYMAGVQALIKAIDYCIGVANTEIIFIPGNHDIETGFTLCIVLDARYRNCDKVSVDISPICRKYRRHGESLIGFCHGNFGKVGDLGLIMSSEVPELWAKTVYREWHTGHYHKKRETKYVAGDTIGGVSVKIIPSLSGTDAWHFENLFVRPYKTGMGFIWDKEEGNIGEVFVNFPLSEYTNKNKKGE